MSARLSMKIPRPALVPVVESAFSDYLVACNRVDDLTRAGADDGIRVMAIDLECVAYAAYLTASVSVFGDAAF